MLVDYRSGARPGRPPPPLCIAVLSLCAAGIAAPALGEPRATENAGGATIEISRLVGRPDEMCRPETFTGRVVARAFNRLGTKLTGMTLEYADGSREFVNVKIPSDMDMALQGRVFQGLQLLSRTGRMAAGRVFRCGAAGRVLDLDAIR